MTLLDFLAAVTLRVFCVDGGYMHGVFLPESTLVAVQTVPIPAGIYLFLSGLVGLSLMRYGHKTTKV